MAQHTSTSDFIVSNIDTTTALAAAGTYTGDPYKVGNCNKFRVGVYSDVAGTLYIKVSLDGTTFYNAKFKSDAGVIGSSLAITAATFTWAELTTVWPYAEVYYVNGSTAQTVFNLATAQVGVGAA